jgi:hypothetical protein
MLKVPSKNALHDPKHQAKVGNPKIRLVLISRLRLRKINTLMKQGKAPNSFFLFFDIKIEMYFMWLNGFLIVFFIHCNFSNFFLVHYKFASHVLLF